MTVTDLSGGGRVGTGERVDRSRAGVGGAVGLVRDKADQLIEDAQGTESLT